MLQKELNLQPEQPREEGKKTTFRDKYQHNGANSQVGFSTIHREMGRRGHLGCSFSLPFSTQLCYDQLRTQDIVRMDWLPLVTCLFLQFRTVAMNAWQHKVAYPLPACHRPTREQLPSDHMLSPQTTLLVSLHLPLLLQLVDWFA